MARITTPVAGFTGVSVGVNFTDGVGETDDEWAIDYFRRHGYGIDVPEEPSGPDGAQKPLDEQSKAELEATATAAGVEFKAPINKGELIALIEAKRLESE